MDRLAPGAGAEPGKFTIRGKGVPLGGTWEGEAEPAATVSPTSEARITTLG
jgi:hypothetical protein